MTRPLWKRLQGRYLLTSEFAVLAANGRVINTVRVVSCMDPMAAPHSARGEREATADLDDIMRGGNGRNLLTWRRR